MTVSHSYELEFSTDSARMKRQARTRVSKNETEHVVCYLKVMKRILHLKGALCDVTIAVVENAQVQVQVQLSTMRCILNGRAGS